MPRRHHPRKVVAPPRFKGYKPYGTTIDSVDEVELLYEEYEAIKLADYDGLTHHEAGVLMGVSRPTFARIYESARQKIARALVEVKALKSVYGNASFDKDWFSCKNCNALFTLPETMTDKSCPMCHATDMVFINDYKKEI
jgi:predicted DNA-binding protein (UPF0251 family)